MSRVFVGCAGWSHPGWNGQVYPKPRLPNFEPLTWLAKRMDTVEVMSSIYRPIEPGTAERWISAVEPNPDFQFVIKLGRQFTHDRLTAPSAIAFFKRGMWPFVNAHRLGALLMKFPGQFRFNRENRDFFLQLRRAFHEFPLAAAMPHESWLADEAVGTLMDHKVAIAHAGSLTSSIGYFRIQEEAPDLSALCQRIEHLGPFAERHFVIFTREKRGISVRLAEEFRARLGGGTYEPAQPSLDFGRAVA